ncbi:MAG: hypothetical protein J0I49_16835 [Pseudonocardia sp.]|uniref:hypothetical protein n=1 Tax=Pseudonocardia sp. TaxID=60912 RepID=UPI001AC7B2EC|nr:hypothetical protein [Pseudonocardia sp.]MBN9099756.1 hypothetical protein [Pseudonocardia sp.]
MTPPTDSLIAALLAAVLGVFAPAAGFVVTVLEPAPTTACSTTGSAGWEAQAQRLADQLESSGSVDAQSLRQQLVSAGLTPSARILLAPTTTAAAGPADWQELAAKLSGELAGSSDPEAQKLAQAIGGTGTPDSTDAPTTRARSTAAPTTGAPGAARPMPGDVGAGDGESGGTGSTAPSRTPTPTPTPTPTAAPSPRRTAAPGPNRPGSGPCPTPPDRSAPATDAPATDAPATDVPAPDTPAPAAPTDGGPSPRSPSTRNPSSRARPAPTRSPSGPSADRRWEQLAGQLAAALAGSTDPRAADLRQALERAGFPSARPGVPESRAAPRTTAVPGPDDPGGGG